MLAASDSHNVLFMTHFSTIRQNPKVSHLYFNMKLIIRELYSNGKLHQPSQALGMQVYFKLL